MSEQETPQENGSQSTHQDIPGLAAIVSTILRVSDVADKRASTFLLSVGTVLLILAVLFKVKLFGLRVGDMSATEFVCLLLACLGCLVAGAYVRMLQERLSNQHEFRMLVTSLRYSLKSQVEATTAALEAQRESQAPIKAIVKPSAPKPPGG